MAESGPQSQPDEAMVDLLIKQVTEGLSPDEQRELDVLDSEVASTYARDLERVAAAVTLAGTSDTESMPAALRTRIEAQLSEELQRGPAGAARRPRPARFRSTAGWWAAAACLVLAVLGWLRSPSLVPGPVQPSPEQEREALLASPGTQKVRLDTTQEPAAARAKADVVWDPQTQKGYVRFVGLEPNDPAQHQYQLWIFDGERDQRYPVDGGVFNVPANAAEVVVPIHAQLPVRAAKAFAVTLEKPGGVVVSAREHVIALGKTAS